jgi:FAD/FMN-containing dehydrogenase
MKIKITARKVVLLSFLVVLLFALHPSLFLICVYAKDQKALTKNESSLIQDASNLNRVKIDTVVKVSNHIDEAAMQIKNLIKLATEQKKSISIAGAQHTMGGHTIYKNGIMLDMKGFNYMKLDTSNNFLLVGSGALWSRIIPYLDQYGKSVKVMQSNNSFSVGGSVSVNCHGWQANSSPIASTVESFRLINSSGQILNCSRNENTELFSLVLGGYGLFGVILDLKLKITDNKTYITKQYITKSKDYFTAFKKHLERDTNIEMAYGRININPDKFMEEAIISTYTVKSGVSNKNNDNTFPAFRRILFRGTVNSPYGKNLRWSTEKFAAHVIDGKAFSRNKLLGEEVEVFQNTDPDYTDILHEYFVPGDSLASFIEAVQKIVPRYHVDLLNITVRNVRNDNDTFLSYAKGEMFGLVMLFNQKKDNVAEKEMNALTQNLINAAIRCKGTYYLPYRLHASKALMYSAYPDAKTFFELKRKYDPLQVFRNQFYEKYKP